MGHYGIRHHNQLKYVKAPTWEQVKTVIDAHGVHQQQFERFYGIAPTMLEKVKSGYRNLPTKHWHIIYECLLMIDEKKPMPVYKHEQPQPAESSFFINIPFFNTSKKKKSPKRKAIKRTGTLCELC